MPKPKARKVTVEDRIDHDGGNDSATPFALHLRLEPKLFELEEAARALQFLLMGNTTWLALARRMLGGDVRAGRDLARMRDAEHPDEQAITATILLLTSHYGAVNDDTQFSEEKQALVLAALLDSAFFALEHLDRERAMLATPQNAYQSSGKAIRAAKRGWAAAVARLRMAVCSYGWADSADRLILLLGTLSRSSQDEGGKHSESRRDATESLDDKVDLIGNVELSSRVVAADAKSAISMLGGSDKKRLAPYEVLAAPVAETVVPDNVDAALDGLAVEMPNFILALDRIREELALRRWAGEASARYAPLLLVGPPGVGKSRFARRLAGSMAMEFGYMSLEGLSDNRSLAGTAAGWSTCEPCWPVREISRLKTANPMLMLDEIDKCRASHNGDNLATLLSWLEPSTAGAAVDPVLGARIDLRGISWVLAANRIDQLPGHLLSRVRVLQIEQPPTEAYDAVLRAILHDLAAEHRLPDYRLLPELSDIQREFLRYEWRRSRSPRVLRKLTERLLARNAMDDSGQRAAH